MTSYDFPLVKWVRMGLTKDSLENIIQSINERSPIKAPEYPAGQRRYIGKQLREEVKNQFNNFNRPLLEVVLNGLDARPDEVHEFKVDVKLRGRHFRCSDNGYSMGLKDMLTLLIIPFNSEKHGEEQIGRFGVGFLSTFNYLVSRPKRSRVIVEAKRPDGSYRLEFYSKSKRVEDLSMKITPLRVTKRTGSTVCIKTKFAWKRGIREYLKEHLREIPVFNGAIRLNRKPVNEGQEDKWYSVPVELMSNGRLVKQRVGLKFDEEGDQILLTSLGIKVQSYNCGTGGGTVSFPLSVKLVEGRDEFKQDESYKTCVDATFLAFEKLIQDEEITDRAPMLASFLPHLASALGIEKVVDIPNLEAIKSRLLKGKQYVLSEAQYDQLEPFLGKDIEKCFMATPVGVKYWKDIVGSKQELIGNLIKPLEIISVEDFQNRFEMDTTYYPNLIALAKHLEGYHKEVALVEVDPGQSAILIEGEENSRAYINLNHPCTQGEHDPVKVYAILSDYFRTKGVQRLRGLNHPEKVEQKIYMNAGDFMVKQYKSLRDY